jgi:hypothetical protein
MNKSLMKILQYVFFLGLGIAIIFYMYHSLSPNDRDQMLAAIRGVRLWIMVPIFISGFLSHFFRALRWKLLLEPLRIHPGTVNTTLAVLIGYVANLVLPRAGEVAKCTVLAKYEKVPADKMVGTILAERAFDVVCLFIIIILACVLQAHIIGTYAQDQFQKLLTKKYLFLAMLAILGAGIIAIILIYRRHKETKIGKFIKGMSHGVSAIIHMKKRWAFIGYTCLIWFMYLLQVYLGFLGLPATDHLSMLAALVVLIFGSIGMITTQGGIGAYTFLVAHILHFYHIDDGNAQAFGWVAWAVQTGIIVILGAAAIIILPILNRTKNAQAGLDKA